MRMDKLTSRFQQSLADAQSLALGRDHQFLEPAHVMLALLDGAGGSVRPLLLKAGADVNQLRAGLLALLEGLPKVEGTPGDIHVSNDLNRVLNVTDKLAQQRGDQFISSELFVLAAFEDRALARLFKEAGVVRGAIEKAIEEVRGGEKVSDANAEESRQALVEALVVGVAIDFRAVDAERIERLDLDDLVVELDAAGTREHDVDLLGILMFVREWLALAGTEAVVAQTGVLGREVFIGEPSLLDLAEPELGG